MSRARTNENARRLKQEPWRKVYGSRRWKDTRKRAIARAGRMCEGCSRTVGLDVHHRIALKHGGEAFDPANLEVLCRVCHRARETPRGRSFHTGRSTSPRWTISLPESRKNGKSPSEQDYWEEFRYHAAKWRNPDNGSPWSKDWGGGIRVENGEFVPSDSPVSPD